jgi:DNA repair protein SbcC/Rad50
LLCLINNFILATLACMIPLKLKIKNFLSYGSEYQDVDFEPYDLVCLSGKNGHGKSGLLDAMTWAVWGQARKSTGTAKPDHGLLRLGQRNMVVVFDFLFNGCKYRVKREFTFAYGKPYSLLEFGILDKEEEKFSSLTDKTIKKTQEKIESLIGLDYDTFINSAFLRQGSSNEFSKKSPKDRKEILGNILGLGQYEQLRKLSMEEGRKLATEKDGLVKLQEHLQQDLDGTAPLKEELAVVSSDLKDCIKLEKAKLDASTKLGKQDEQLKDKARQKEQLKFQVNKLNDAYESGLEQLKRCKGEWKRQHSRFILCSQKDLNLEKEKAAKLLKEFKEKQVVFFKLKDEALDCGKALQEAEGRLKLEWQKELGQKRFIVQKLSSEVVALKVRSKEFVDSALSGSKDLEELRAEIKKLESSFAKADAASLQKLEVWFDKAKAYYHSWVSQGNLVQAEIKSLTKKSDTLSTDNPSCPLCEQMLTSSRKKFLKVKFDKQSKFHLHRFKRISKLLKELKDTLIDEHNKLQDVRTKAENNRLVESKLNDKRKILLKLTTELKDVDAKQVELNAKFKELSKLLKEKEHELSEWEKNAESFVTKNKDYLVAKEGLDTLAKKVKDLAYSEEEHKRLEEINASFVDSKNSMDVASIKELKAQLAEQAFGWLKTLRLQAKEIADLGEQLKKLSTVEAEQKTLEKDRSVLEKELADVVGKKQVLVKKETELKIKLTKLKELAKKQADLTKQVKALDSAIDEYKVVSTALSKDGIQALLIEEAIPEIEEEANDLLSRLTNNQSQIFIESLRDLKKGGTKETLDIKISDAAGIRPYEMFSGGEAFRIDFALRIAISKLLARRAGTALQTLIIDEGFGSQDEEGLAQIMEAIYKIQEDFSKVIVVSHLPTLKEQFPVHFMIEKGPAGSCIEVLQQG